jgi:hypothetical protein
VVLQLAFLLGSVIGHLGVATPTECPMAFFSCQRVASNDAKYICTAAAHSGGAAHPPQLAWRLSAGKIVGDRKSFQITIDSARVKSQTITVTLKVHWKNVDRICDRIVTDKIELH